MKKIDKNTKWWIGAEKEWSFQDKNGDWWLIKDKGKKEEKKVNPCNAPEAIISYGEGIKKIIFSCLIASLLGMSLALNVFLYLKVESFKNVIPTQKVIHSIGLDNGN
tara:strand:+ start:339 stop:659 length:321 start_codon:yes stop_codon:yes gene_type:complete